MQTLKAEVRPSQMTPQSYWKDLKTASDIQKLSGLQCNIEKTMVIPVGEITDLSLKLCEDINLEWASEFKILGVNIDNKLEKLHSNIENCTRKVRVIINKW